MQDYGMAPGSAGEARQAADNEATCSAQRRERWSADRVRARARWWPVDGQVQRDEGSRQDGEREAQNKPELAQLLVCTDDGKVHEVQVCQITLHSDVDEGLAKDLARDLLLGKISGATVHWSDDKDKRNSELQDTRIAMRAERDKRIKMRDVSEDPAAAMPSDPKAPSKSDAPVPALKRPAAAPAPSPEPADKKAKASREESAAGSDDDDDQEDEEEEKIDGSALDEDERRDVPDSSGSDGSDSNLMSDMHMSFSQFSAMHL